MHRLQWCVWLCTTYILAAAAAAVSLRAATIGKRDHM